MHHQLDSVVDACSIRLAGLGDRFDCLDVVAEILVSQLVFAGAHRVDVATDRVDLAVVDDPPVGVGEVPRPERVR
jgi:hypothetical protein